MNVYLNVVAVERPIAYIPTYDLLGLLYSYYLNVIATERDSSAIQMQ